MPRRRDRDSLHHPCHPPRPSHTYDTITTHRDARRARSRTIVQAQASKLLLTNKTTHHNAESHIPIPPYGIKDTRNISLCNPLLQQTCRPLRDSVTRNPAPGARPESSHPRIYRLFDAPLFQAHQLFDSYHPSPSSSEPEPSLSSSESEPSPSLSEPEPSPSESQLPSEPENRGSNGFVQSEWS